MTLFTRQPEEQAVLASLLNRRPSQSGPAAQDRANRSEIAHELNPVPAITTHGCDLKPLFLLEFFAGCASDLASARTMTWRGTDQNFLSTSVAQHGQDREI
ncbi:MAG: hypothetical protein R3D32_00145 [Nitratireductor sp.]